MNMQAYFYFLSHVHYKIKDPSLYMVQTYNDDLSYTYAEYFKDYAISAANIIECVKGVHSPYSFITYMCTNASDRVLQEAHQYLLDEYNDILKRYATIMLLLKNYLKISHTPALLNYVDPIPQNTLNDIYNDRYEIDSIDDIFYRINSNNDNITTIFNSIISAYPSFITVFYNTCNLQYQLNPILPYKNIFTLIDLISDRLIHKKDLVALQRLQKYYHYNHLLQNVYKDAKVGDNKNKIMNINFIKSLSYVIHKMTNNEKILFGVLLKDYADDKYFYHHINNMIVYDNDHTITLNEDQNIVDEQTEIIDMNHDMNTGIFAVGTATIDSMNKITIEISNDGSDRLAKVITGLKSSVERYKKFSQVGFFGKMFTSDIEIQANITIAVIDFENLLDKGANIITSLNSQYNGFTSLYDDLKNIHDQFDQDIIQCDTYLESADVSQSDKQRLVRRKNDLISAQLLAKTTAMQYELAKNNIGILVDKFTAIEQVLKPAIDMNMKISTTEFKSIAKLIN